jgi:hypothetical protein
MEAESDSRQPFSLGQLLLPIVKGPEAVSSQFQSSRHMQRVQRADPQRGCMTPGKLDAGKVGPLRLTCGDQHSTVEILFEVRVCYPSLIWRNLSAKDMLVKGVCKFGAMEWREDYKWPLPHLLLSFRRVPVPQVEGHEETGVRVNDQ